MAKEKKEKFELEVKEPPLKGPYFAFLLFCGFLIGFFLVQPYLIEEIFNSLFSPKDSIVVSSPILKRKSRSDIGILVIAEENLDLNEFEAALTSVECYSKIHGYGFQIIKISHFWKLKCNNKNPKFLRHCIASYLAQWHAWTLVLPPDAGVVNPHRKIEDYIADDKLNLIFLERNWNWEISPESYLIRNTSFARKFLVKLSQLEHQIPESFHGSDSEALLWHFVNEFYSGKVPFQLSPSECREIWSLSHSYNHLEIFEACCRQILGDRREFCDGKSCISLMSRGKAWIRDGWETESKWALENDFMLFGWKESSRIPSTDEDNAWNRASKRLSTSPWHSPFPDKFSFDIKKCKSGKIEWKWRQSLLIKNSELQQIFEKIQEKAQNAFLKTLTYVPNFL